MPLIRPVPRDISPADIVDVCGESPGFVCRNVLRITESRSAADVAQWIMDLPLRILFILLGAWFANRLVRKLIHRVVAGIVSDQTPLAVKAVRKVRDNSLLSTDSVPTMRSTARAKTMASVLKSVTSIVIWTIAGLLVLGEVGINLAPLIAGAGIVGVAVGFGAQSLVKDFLSGLFMLAEDQYGVGDIVDVGEASGVVEAVNLRTTRIRSVDGTVWHVPNGEIRRVGNMSQQWARAVLDIGVAYSSDIDRAAQIAKEVADAVHADPDFALKIIEDPEVLGVERLDASAVVIRLVVKTRPAEQWNVSREIRKRLKKRFDEEGIEIPFPQQVMWLRQEAVPGTPPSSTVPAAPADLLPPEDRGDDDRE
ncbi:MAG: mechanosensitive ion channel family protein [Ilumatobacteraceae bacterium]